jgi:hypothetical protein
MAFWNIRLFTVAGVVFLHHFFDCFTRFARALLNAAQQLLLHALDIMEIVVGEVGPFLFQFAFRDVPVAFDFECVHNIALAFVLIRRRCGGKIFPQPSYLALLLNIGAICFLGKFPALQFCRPPNLKVIAAVEPQRQ